jgi:hypothetical protein
MFVPSLSWQTDNDGFDDSYEKWNKCRFLTNPHGNFGAERFAPWPCGVKTYHIRRTFSDSWHIASSSWCQTHEWVQ